MPHHYTKAESEFIRNNFSGRTRAELTDLFNNEFGLQLGINQITAYTKNHKLKNGLGGYFSRGHEPFNKGIKGIHSSPKTEFRKGNRPWNYKPVGTERINGDGYVDVKIADPKKWKPKHLIIWEAEHGPIPKGHVVIFGDGNKLNVKLDNLVLVSRAQLVRMNQNGLIQNHIELTKSGAIVANIINTYTQRKKNLKGRRDAKCQQKVNT